jgi:hypothetical protein
MFSHLKPFWSFRLIGQNLKIDDWLFAFFSLFMTDRKDFFGRSGQAPEDDD